MVPSPSDVTRIRYAATLVIRLGAIWMMLSSLLPIVWYAVDAFVMGPLFDRGFMSGIGFDEWVPSVVYTSIQVAGWFALFWFAPRIARFFVRMPSRLLCPKCDYDLTSSTERACPECGLALDEKFRTKVDE